MDDIRNERSWEEMRALEDAERAERRIMNIPKCSTGTDAGVVVGGSTKGTCAGLEDRQRRPHHSWNPGVVPRRPIGYRIRTWRGAGEVERGGLENRCPRKWTVGSNPTPSASLPATRASQAVPGAA